MRSQGCYEDSCSLWYRYSTVFVLAFVNFYEQKEMSNHLGFVVIFHCLEPIDQEIEPDIMGCHIWS